MTVQKGERTVRRLPGMEEAPRHSPGDIWSIEESMVQVVKWDSRLHIHRYSLQHQSWSHQQHYTETLGRFMQSADKVYALL